MKFFGRCSPLKDHAPDPAPLGGQSQVPQSFLLNLGRTTKIASSVGETDIIEPRFLSSDQHVFKLQSVIRATPVGPTDVSGKILELQATINSSSSG